MKNWIISRLSETQKKLAGKLAAELNISKMLAKLFILRGRSDSDSATKFLDTDIRGLHSPFLLRDMKIATERITAAIENKEKILIFGDYDVDGITSSSILYMFLKKCGADVEVYLPNRFNEGYGITDISIANFKDHGYNLVITVDCGISSIREVEIIKELGMDIIITDHHHCQSEIPKALAVINPHREDCSYPFKNLAGVGVAFKLIGALAEVLNIENYINDYIDIVAVGTIADIVDLTGENRILVSNGLKKLQCTDNLGLRELINIAGLKDKEITSISVAFGLAPRINSAGRLGDAKRAVHLITTDSLEQARLLAEELNNENISRQETEAKVLSQVYSYIEDNHDFEKNKVIVAIGEGWHHGVIGIVASKVIEKYYRPCIILSKEEDGSCKGSARSIPGFNLFNALQNCEDLLVKFGGHELAAGLTVLDENVQHFSEQINTYAKEFLLEGDLIPRINIDTEIFEEDISIKAVKELKLLAPFGMGNAMPIFVLCNLKIESFKTMSEDKHIKLTLSGGGLIADAVGFGMGYLKDTLKSGDFIDLACTLEINVWNNVEKIQLMIKDLKPCEATSNYMQYYRTLDNTICYRDIRVGMHQNEMISENNEGHKEGHGNKEKVSNEVREIQRDKVAKGKNKDMAIIGETVDGLENNTEIARTDEIVNGLKNYKHLTRTGEPNKELEENNYYLNNIADRTLAVRPFIAFKEEDFSEILKLIKTNNEENKKTFVLLNDLEALETIDAWLRDDFYGAAKVCFGDILLESSKNIYIVVNPSKDCVERIVGENVIIFGNWFDEIYFETIANAIDKKCLFLYNIKIGSKSSFTIVPSRNHIGAVYQYVQALHSDCVKIDDIGKLTELVDKRCGLGINAFLVFKSLEILNELDILQVVFENNNTIVIKISNTGKKVSLEDSSIYRKLHSLTV